MYVNWAQNNEHPVTKKHYNAVCPRSLAQIYILSYYIYKLSHISIGRSIYCVKSIYMVFSMYLNWTQYNENHVTETYAISFIEL